MDEGNISSWVPLQGLGAWPHFHPINMFGWLKVWHTLADMGVSSEVGRVVPAGSIEDGMNELMLVTCALPRHPMRHVLTSVNGEDKWLCTMMSLGLWMGRNWS